MKTLCFPLSLAVLLSATSLRAQQLAFFNPPAAASAPVVGSVPAALTGESTSLIDPGASAIMLVPARAAFNPRTRYAAEDWGELGAIAALRFGDYKSTVKALSDPANFHEAELPNALVHDHPGFAAFEAGTVVVNYYAYRFLVRRDHRTLARLGQYVNIGCVAWTVGNNYYGLHKFWPQSNIPLNETDRQSGVR
jgi:hypothetical protein